MLNIILIIILLFLIIVFCEAFTNAIENLGKILNIGDGALGSIFAAIGTALPETILPVIAVFGAYITHSNISIGKDIGMGAVIGSPFILSTIAFLCVGLTVLFDAFVNKKKSEIPFDNTCLSRDLKYFLFAYSLGVLAGIINISFIKYLIGIFLPLYYFFYMTRTINRTDCTCADGSCIKELYLIDIFKLKSVKNIMFFVLLQLFIAVLGLVFSVHYFVESVKISASYIGISALIMSLFLAPISTELPETVNGIVWSKNKKYTLAVCNISGALMFQACFPMAIGIFLTDWNFSQNIILNVLCVFISVIYLYIITRKKDKIVNAEMLLLCGIPYFAYLFYTILSLK